MAYYSEEEVKQKAWTDYWKLYLILGLLVVGFIFHGKLGAFAFDKAWTYVLGTISGITLIELAFIEFFHRTPKLLWNGGFDTTNGNYYEGGNYAVFTRAIRALNYEQDMKGPTYVVPLDAVNKRGKSVDLGVFMQMTAFEKLPWPARAVISEHDLRPPYFLGYVDLEQMDEEINDPKLISGVNKPKASRLVFELMEQNNIITVLERKLEEAYNVSEETIAAKERLREIMTGPKGIEEKVKGIFREKEEEAK